MFTEDIQQTIGVLGPLVDDVVVLIGLDQATRRGTDCGTHVGDEEAAIGLRADLIRDRGEQRTVRLLELWLVGIGGVKVVGGVLDSDEYMF